jgi:serine protease
MARTSTRIRLWTVAAASLTAVFVFAAIAPDAVKAGANSPQARAPQTERVDVKFREGTTVRLREGHLLSLTGDDVGGLRTLLRLFPGVRVERLFAAPEAALTAQKARLEGRSHRQLADLNLYFRLTTDSPSESASLAAALRSLDLVQTAYVEPKATASPTTPSFVGYQGYRGAAPAGIDPGAAAGYPGGRGNRVRLFDLEYNWNTSHEDLTRTQNAFISSGASCDPFSNTNHGTAVLGEIVGDDNAIGVTGLVPEVGIAMVNTANWVNGQCAANVANAVNVARTNATAGDVILIEQQTDACYPNNCLVPVEWNRAEYDAVSWATAAGIVVVEAGGNGNQNLDDPYYGSPFPRGLADSGAIIVGAGAAPNCTMWPGRPARSRLDFSTYGSRVNVQGWGECVTTTGYGAYYNGGTQNSWYTGGPSGTVGFTGTSSASPIVASAAASLSSAYEAATGRNLLPRDVRRILTDTGTAQDTMSGGALAGRVGPLPNLRAALARAIDTTPPSVSAPTQSVSLNWTLGATDIPVTISWSASDPGGIAQYSLWMSTNGGAFASVSLQDQTATSATLSLTPTNSYRFAVAARDGAGNWSGYAYGSTFTVDAHQETSAAITYSSGWARYAWSSAYGGYENSSSTAGASARLSFTGRSVAWVAPTATNRGQAYLYVDGAYAGTLDLYSASTVARKIVFSRSWSFSAAHTLEVRVVGTSGRPTIDVDAFVVLR